MLLEFVEPLIHRITYMGNCDRFGVSVHLDRFCRPYSDDERRYDDQSADRQVCPEGFTHTFHYTTRHKNRGGLALGAREGLDIRSPPSIQVEVLENAVLDGAVTLRIHVD